MSYRVKVFLSLFLFGVVLGFVENITAIYFATDHAINLRAVIISILVVIPFAAIGELIVDRVNLISTNKRKGLKRLEVFLEFMIFGLVMGVVEDLIVITLLTGKAITLEVVGIVFLVTLPFAIVGELIVDNTDWFSKKKKI